MTLKDLITKYQTQLALDPVQLVARLMQEIVEKYKGFSQDLIAFSSFNYNWQDMIQAFEHVKNLGLSHSYSYIVAYAVRRAAVQYIRDPSKRSDVWHLLELSSMRSTGVGKQKLAERLQDYESGLWRARIIADLGEAEKGFLVLESQVDQLAKQVRNEYGRNLGTNIEEVVIVHRGVIAEEKENLTYLKAQVWVLSPSRKIDAG